MKRAMWIISIFSIVMTAVAVQFMPDLVPMHYNFEGEIDRWGSKYENFIFPAIIIGFALFWQILIMYYEKKASKSQDKKLSSEALSNAKILKISAISMAVMFTIMHGIFLYKDCVISDKNMVKVNMDIGKVTCFLCGTLLIVLGNIIPRAKRNPLLGIRTKWSMHNDVTWAKSNRFGGVALVITGVLLVVTSVFVKEIVAMICLFAYILVDVVITVIYSYKVYKDEIIKK